MRDGRRTSAEWDVQSGPRNYLALAGTQGASAALSFIGIWLATHLLGASGYGVLAAALAASQLVGQAAIQWSAVSLVRYGCEEFVRTGQIIAAFWTRLFILIVNLLLLLAVCPIWLPRVSAWLHLSPDFQPFIIAHIIVYAAWIHVQHALQASKLPRLQGGLLVLERGQTVLALVLLTLLRDASVYRVAQAYIVAPLTVIGIGVWHLRNLIYPNVRLSAATLKALLLFSLPVIPSCLVGFFSTNYLDAFFITRYLSTADLGKYSVAYQLTGMLLQFPLIGGSLMLPFFVTLEAKGKTERMAWFLQVILPVMTLIWSLTCTIAAAVSGQLISLLLGPEFQIVVVLAWPLMAVAALAGPNTMGLAHVANARSLTYIALVSSIAAAAVNLVLNMILIPRHGLLGCAWATVGAYGISLVVTLNLTHWRVLPCRSWSLSAVLPPVVGAAWMAWRHDGMEALGLALLVSSFIFIRHRNCIRTGLQGLATVLAFGR